MLVIYVDYRDVENSMWNIRLFYVEKWSSGGQILFNVEIYPAIGKVDFYVESTSILRQKVSVRIWYIFQRRINVDSTFEFAYPQGLSTVSYTHLTLPTNREV